MSDMKQELIDLNREIGTAERNRDSDKLRNILADDMAFRRASGAVVDKQAYLDDLKSPSNTYEFVHAEDVEVLPYGDAMALVSLRVWAKGKRGDKVFEGIYRNTRLFLKREGKWQCAAWFNTPAEGFPT